MRPIYQTRQWKHPEGYKYLAPWTNSVFLRFIVRKFTETLPRSEYRAKNQINDAARSVTANIEEGYKRPTTKEYLDFLGFSQGSLEEVKGDVRRLMQDGFLKSKPGSSLSDIRVNLEEIKGLLEETKGEVPLDVLYPPLSILKGNELTFEIFMELINKTEYLIRRLVSSLENKTDEKTKQAYGDLDKEAEDFDDKLKELARRRA